MAVLNALQGISGRGDVRTAATRGNRAMHEKATLTPRAIVGPNGAGFLVGATHGCALRATG